MFTGIIKEVGKLNKIIRINTGLEIEVSSSLLTKDMKPGDSIAVNGCCLTVKDFQAGNSFKADISFATLKATTFGLLRAGSYLNLEDAVKLSDKLGGHIVSGHIDNTGMITKISKKGDFHKIDIRIPKNILPFTAPKGSISVDGVSLTIADCVNEIMEFAIILFTFENTNFKYKKTGEKVNIEVDLMARYILNMAKYSNPISGSTAADPSYFLNISKMWGVADEIKNKNDKNFDLEEKLKKYGFKK
ncbi:MAG: riboflavin synthase [Actinobacteria bacterium]|nr:riboflavin synthase [Actinomycetota bacterium]